MTADQKRRVLEEITKMDQFIAKEGQRNAAIRPAETQKYLDFCIAHRAKLIGMLAA